MARAAGATPLRVPEPDRIVFLTEMNLRLLNGRRLYTVMD